MSSTIHRDTAFLNRFRSLWARKRRVELGQVAVTTLLLALLGLGGLAVADYALELDRSTRVIALGAMLGAVVVFAGNSLWRTMRRWSQPTAAAEIEAAFPQLGQSVRTTVQFGAMQVEQVRSEGVATTLVTALAEQTHQRALPLTIDEVKIDLTPPSYTGQPTSTSLDVNLSVLQGTVAKFSFQFDKPVKSAAIVFAPRKQSRDDDDKNEAEVVPLAISPVSGTALAAGVSRGESTSRQSTKPVASSLLKNVTWTPSSE